MKKNLLTLIVLSVLFFACHHNDDDNNPVTILTETNYLSENNFNQSRLNDEIALIEVVIDSLNTIIDMGQADNTTQQNLDSANTQHGLLNAELADLVQKGNPIPLPPPPPPCPDNLTCFPKDVIYAVTLGENIDLLIEIIDDQGITIGSSANSPLVQLPGYNSNFKFQQISISDYSGPVTILVEKIDSQNNTVRYQASGYTQ